MSVKILYEALRAFENKEFDVADKRLHEAFRNIMKKKLQESWDASDDALEDDDFSMDVAEESEEDADLLDEIDNEMIGEASCVKEENEAGWEDLNLTEADDAEEGSESVDTASTDLEQEMEDESKDDSLEDKIEDEFDDLEELFRELVGKDSENCTAERLTEAVSGNFVAVTNFNEEKYGWDVWFVAPKQADDVQATVTDWLVNEGYEADVVVLSPALSKKVAAAKPRAKLMTQISPEFVKKGKTFVSADHPVASDISVELDFGMGDRLEEARGRSSGYVEKRGPKWLAFDEEGNQIGSFATREQAQKALV